MKKRKTVVIAVVLALALTLPLSVSALAPGGELAEVAESQPVKIDQTSSAKTVDVMDDLTGASVTLSTETLPEDVNSVSLETTALPKEDEKTAMNDVKAAIKGAYISSESEQITKDYDITPVSAIVLNLVDQSGKAKNKISKLKNSIDFTIPVAKKINAVAYINPETGKLVIIEGKVKNGFMTFTTDIIGVTFVLVKLTKK